MIEVTDEMKAAFRAAQEQRAAELVAEGAPLGGHDILDRGLAAVLALYERGPDFPGEPVWSGDRAKKLTLEMESIIQVEVANLGTADRPSQVVRLLRQAAGEVEQAWREAR